MKRIVASVLFVIATSLGMAGCADTTQTEKTAKIETPEGTTEKKVTEEVTKSGDAPPPTPATPPNP
jgi:hypothetical protein